MPTTWHLKWHYKCMPNPAIFERSVQTIVGTELGLIASSAPTNVIEILSPPTNRCFLTQATTEPTLTMNKQIRRFLIEKANERCQRCGWAEQTCKDWARSPRDRTHRRRLAKHVTESNLAVLCPNCHALTPTFRAMNRGRGRPGRPGLRPRPVQAEIVPPPRPRLSRGTLRIDAIRSSCGVITARSARLRSALRAEIVHVFQDERVLRVRCVGIAVHEKDVVVRTAAR